MVDDLEAIGLAAVDRFITTFNSRDAALWADSLNFPHVRPSPFGPINVAQTRDEYVRRFDYGRILDTGWDHSSWDYKRLLHTSADKIHVAGQWSRYDVQGNKILSTPIVYIVTHNDGHWGIQSRFGSDFADDEDTSDIEARAFDLVTAYVAHQNKANVTAAAQLLNYPHFRIGTENLVGTSSAELFQTGNFDIKIDSMMAVQGGRFSVNLALDLTLDLDAGTRKRQAVTNITIRDDHLGIQAWSLLEPG